MKAIRIEEYGLETLRLGNLQLPEPVSRPGVARAFHFWHFLSD